MHCLLKCKNIHKQQLLGIAFLRNMTLQHCMIGYRRFDAKHRPHHKFRYTLVLYI